MTGTSEALLSTVRAYSALTTALFQSIEHPGAQPAVVQDSVAGKRWSASSSGELLRALKEVDALLASCIEVARKHVRNQARIERLQASAKRRDRETRGAIAQLDAMGGELDILVRLGREELASIAKAEESPIPHADLLSYAQKLARYTSAPPGFALAPPATEDKKDQDDATLALGPDYNQCAERAAAYYDPAMPSMPQEMPFPSDAMMRQGILNTGDMLAGAPMAEEPEDEAMQEPELVPAYSQLHAQQQQQRQQEEEEAFDLDLN